MALEGAIFVESFLFYLWLVFRYLFIVLLFLYLAFGIDDLIVDAVYYVRVVYRWLFKRKWVKPVTLGQLRGVPEQRLAILVPAWDESAVIARMLINTAGTLDYRNYDIFVGTYPNDVGTRREVEKVQEIYSNIHVVEVGHDGPTCKADCLNAVMDGLHAFERSHRVRFEGFVLHDSEDVVHPQSLHFYNYLMPRVQFIQIPVFPLPCRPWQLTAGTYMDEFAENHTKNLRVRELLGHALPSAGVGTAFSRAAIEFLEEQGHTQIFDGTSVAEDYQVGLKLAHFKGQKIFLQQMVGRAAATTGNGDKPKRLKEPLATREMFPRTLGAAIRQKSRWVVGIAFQGWSQGWTRSLGDNYFLYRDRKSVLANIAVMLGYVVVAYMFINQIGGAMGFAVAPSLLAPHEWYLWLVKVVLCVFIWRVANRVYASWHVYGAVHGMLALPRVVFSNVLNFLATCRAIGIYTTSRLRGRQLAWAKTSHTFPTDALLSAYHRKLGDVLVASRFVSKDDLHMALEAQKTSGKRLGDILVEMGVLWEEDLVCSLAQQQHRLAVEIDPYLVADDVLKMVPPKIARQHRVFPIEKRDGMLILATDRAVDEVMAVDLPRLLGTQVLVEMCATPDMEFALRHAYDLKDISSLPPDHVLGERLVEKGLISRDDLKCALRDQKRHENHRLDETLVESGALTREQLDAAVMEG
jgi:adsorption protein B